MSNQWNTPIDKLMLWRTSNWVRYESQSGGLTLRINYDQLMITTDTKVLESFNMNNKLKGVFKDDILILIVSTTGQEVIRKFKFQLKMDVVLCLYKLGEHFPVIKHSSLQSKNNAQTKYRNIEEVLQHALQNKESTTEITLPPSYENFVKLCLLDPTFPQTVNETKKILQEKILKTNRQYYD